MRHWIAIVALLAGCGGAGLTERSTTAREHIYAVTELVDPLQMALLDMCEVATRIEHPLARDRAEQICDAAFDSFARMGQYQRHIVMILDLVDAIMPQITMLTAAPGMPEELETEPQEPPEDDDEDWGVE